MTQRIATKHDEQIRGHDKAAQYLIEQAEACETNGDGKDRAHVILVGFAIDLGTVELHA